MINQRLISDLNNWLPVHYWNGILLVPELRNSADSFEVIAPSALLRSLGVCQMARTVNFRV